MTDQARAAARPARADVRSPPSPLRSWRSAVFAPAGDGPLRRRRGRDGAGLAGAVVTLACCLLIIRYDPRIDRAITQVIQPPWTVTWPVTVVYEAGSLGVMAVLAALAVIARTRAIARDIALSAACAAAVSGVLIALLGTSGGRPAGVVAAGYPLSFPVPRMALLMAVTAAALPYLARGTRRLTGLFVTLVALACAVAGRGLPVNVAGSLAIGWGAALAVRLVFGSPLGLASSGDVRLLLRDLGIGADEVRPLSRQVRGVAKYHATEAGQTGSRTRRLSIEVYGRDAADAALVTKAGRFLLYRDSGTTFTITRLQQVEHQAYLTLRASQVGATVPELVEAGIAGPAKDALVVCRVPAGSALADADAAEVSDAGLDDLYRQLLALRRARIGHGAISGDTLLADAGSKTIVIAEFRSAASGASPDRLDRDLAGAMAATALAVGIPRAAGAAARCLPRDILGGALRHLHGPALDPVLRRQVRAHGTALKELRERAAAAASIEVPKLVEARRVSWPTLVLVTGALIGSWALIGVLLSVAESFDTVIAAEWLWVVPAFILAQLTYAASAVAGLGSVTGPLPFMRMLAVEVASTFSALAGGKAAVFATRVRFFQQEGYDASAALSSGVILAGVTWIALLVLLAISLPLAWGSIRLEALPLSGNSKTVWLILAAVVAIALAAGLVLAMPRLRRRAAKKALPQARSIMGNFKAVASSPGKLLLLGSGAVARELLVALTLSLSLRAFGEHLRLPVLIVVIGLATIAGAASPSPGGMGVVEASLILGLTTAGAAEANATAAVFIQRLFTSYLPPAWGSLILLWLRKREYL